MANPIPIDYQQHRAAALQAAHTMNAAVPTRAYTVLTIHTPHRWRGTVRPAVVELLVRGTDTTVAAGIAVALGWPPDPTRVYVSDKMDRLQWAGTINSVPALITAHTSIL